MIEVNTSFYRIPSPAMTGTWAEKTRRLVFVFKLFQGFTHQEHWNPGDTDSFAEMCRPVQEAGRFGGVLAQFPFYFRRNDGTEHRVREICETFGALGVFFEFRDESWFQPGALDFLKNEGGMICNIDLPGGDRFLNTTQEVIGDRGYLRLHGRNSRAWFSRAAGVEEKYDYLYNARELDAIAARIASIAQKAQNTFVVANNHYKGKAAVNTIQLKEACTGRTTESPETLKSAYPVLAEGETLFG
jgi:uncharacterized protein YecE (DUF72 family)